MVILWMMDNWIIHKSCLKSCLKAIDNNLFNGIINITSD